MVAPLTLRTVCSVLFIICGAVVLGISIHIEHATRVIGYKSSTFTFDAFVGAFTLFVEVLGLIARWVPALNRFVPLPVEGGIALLLWIFWIASAINTTQFTEMDRSVCKHLDDLFDLPEFKNVDQQTLQVLRNVFEDTCSELHAQLAFLWIGFIVATLVLGYTAVLTLRTRSRGGKSIRETTFRNYTTVMHTHEDPFQDPVGATAGPTVGVPSPGRPGRA